MTEPAHKLDPNIPREYNIRRVVGKQVHAADARAIGRSFGHDGAPQRGHACGAGL